MGRRETVLTRVQEAAVPEQIPGAAEVRLLVHPDHSRVLRAVAANIF